MNFIKIATFVFLLFSGLSLLNGMDWDRVEQEAIATSERVQKSCFSVVTDRGGWGSAVLVSAKGHLLSAAHVYDEVGQGVTLLQNGFAGTKARVVRLDREHDLAILLVNDPSVVAGITVPILSNVEIESSSVVLALGHTSGFQKGRKAPVRIGLGVREEDSGQLLSTCRLSIGDSGGPLFNLDGELVGVHSAIRHRDRFASHASGCSIREFLEELELGS